MISFLLCVILLILGYILYSRRIEALFGPDDRITPAVRLEDGVDFVPMPVWKIFLIQLLNIAGTGPIFGALSGALFGPIVYLWIVLGCIFAGGVHDYLGGMLSMRHDGASVSELTGLYLGKTMKLVMRIFSVVLLVMCGVVFTVGPAELIGFLTPEKLNGRFWLWIILLYYFIATFVPIDKVIGRIYPLFGVCLIVMAFGVGGSMLFSGRFDMPELWNCFENANAQGTPVWPFLFITVACGAISGFHGTQSPMMARCITSEKEGRRVFFGAMAAEGIIALVWAAAGVTVYESSADLLAAGGGCSSVVYAVCQTTMGKVGGLLALIGVVACPISSGDTAYRSARLTLADWLQLDQSSWKKRLLVTLPVLLAGALICQVDYSKVWRYFSWANQTLAMLMLWTAAVYFAKDGKLVLPVVIPAVFMTAVTATYFFAAPECLGMLWDQLCIPYSLSYRIAVGAGAVLGAVFLLIFLRFRSALAGPDGRRIRKKD